MYKAFFGSAFSKEAIRSIWAEKILYILTMAATLSLLSSGTNSYAFLYL